MTRNTELAPLLKRLKLSAMLDTLPERIALTRREQLDYLSFLEIILVDEINRRDNRHTELRLRSAGFEEICRLEDFDWSASITLDRRLLDAVFSLQFLLKHEHVIHVKHFGRLLPHRRMLPSFWRLLIDAHRSQVNRSHLIDLSVFG